MKTLHNFLINTHIKDIDALHAKNNYDFVDMGTDVLWCSNDILSGTKQLLYFQGFGAFGVNKNTSDIENKVEALENITDSAESRNYDWRMPTEKDCEDLIKACTFKEVDGGYELTSKKTKNTVFFPYTGYWDRIYKEWRLDKDYMCFTSTISKKTYGVGTDMFIMDLSNRSQETFSFSRVNRCVIRPVKNK